MWIVRGFVGPEPDLSQVSSDLPTLVCNTSVLSSVLNRKKILVQILARWENWEDVWNKVVAVRTQTLYFLTCHTRAQEGADGDRPGAGAHLGGWVPGTALPALKDARYLALLLGSGREVQQEPSSGSFPREALAPDLYRLLSQQL